MSVALPGAEILPKNTFVTGLMTQSKEYVKNNLKTVILVAVIVVAVIVFAIIFQKLYVQGIAPKAENPEEDLDDYGQNSCEVIYFYVDWCPYCKKTTKTWEDFEKKWKNKTLNGYTIVTSKIDCEQQEAIANKFEVQSYPTIKCVMNGKVTEFDAKPTAESLDQFINTVCSA